jgi:hypothetical protein
LPFVLMVALLNAQDLSSTSHPLLTLAFNVPAAAALTFAIGYLGPLSAAVTILVGNIVARIAGVGTGAWYAPRCTAYLLVVVALAAFGLRNAIAGRALFGREEERKAANAAA